MKALVTGATGFIGACLVHQLIREGYDTHVFAREQSNCWRLQHVFPFISRHNVDLADFDAVKKTVSDVKPNLIFHLATYGGFAFQREWQNIFLANFMGTVNLVQACEKVGFDYFVNTGSSSEYGLKEAVMSEESTLTPVSDYGVSKAAATLYCQSEALQKNLPIVTVRLFSPYGPWDDSRRFIPWCVKEMMAGRKINLLTPDAVRDYVYIDDVVAFYLQLIQQSARAATIFNVGSGQQITIRALAEAIAACLDVQPTFNFGDNNKRLTESPVWIAQIENAKKVGWFPKTKLQEGLQKTVLWMKEHKEMYS